VAVLTEWTMGVMAKAKVRPTGIRRITAESI